MGSTVLPQKMLDAKATPPWRGLANWLHLSSATNDRAALAVTPGRSERGSSETRGAVRLPALTDFLIAARIAGDINAA